MRKWIGALVLKISTISILAIFLALVALIYSIGNGVPFIEGDNKITSGKAYNFEIGMSKQDTFRIIQKHYNKEGYYLRTLWLKDSEIDNKLESFQNTEWKKYPHRKYSEYKVLISNIDEITPPFQYGARWDIDMPAAWVNTIYLSFEDELLTEIQKSRWLFERP